MRTRSKLLVAVVTATAFLGLAVGSASANRLEVTNAERGFRFAWNEWHFSVSGETITCRLTLEGSFTTRTTVKRDNEVIGKITRAALSSPCTGGSVSVLTATLPWEVQYDSFTGTLPSIRSVIFDIVGASYQIQTPGVEPCLFISETNEPMRGIASVAASGELTTFAADRNARIGTRGGFLCAFAGKGSFEGTANATVLGGTAHLILRLI